MTMWCMARTSTWRSSARRSSRVRSSGPVARSKRWAPSSATSARTAPSRSRPGGASSTGSGAPVAGSTTWYGSPSCSRKTVRSAGCRSVRACRAPASARWSSGPSRAMALTSLYRELSGSIRCRNHIRCWAYDSGARRSRGRWAVRRSSSRYGRPAATCSGERPKSTKAAISSAPHGAQRVQDGPHALRGADQRARGAVPLVRALQDELQVLLRGVLVVQGEAEAVGDLPEERERGAQVAAERAVGLLAGGGEVGAEVAVHQHHHAPGPGVQAVLGPGAPVEGDVGGQLLDALGHQIGDHAEVVAGGLAEAVRVADDRRVHRRQLLERARVQVHLDLLAAAVAAPVGLAAPQRPDRVDLPVHQLLVGAVAVGEEQEVVGVPAAGAA